MKKCNVKAFALLKKVREEEPIIHHITNWVTIYDCANVVKVLGASPVMAHDKDEVAEMTGIASALVLNIGTLTGDVVESMKRAIPSAKKKGIPIILDVCGAGATTLRDKACFELIDTVAITIIKGNASEIARISGESVKTKGVDSGDVELDMCELAKGLALKRNCTVVITGREDIVTDGRVLYKVSNGHSMMTGIVGTGCMATSVIATFATVDKNVAYAATAGLVCYEIAAELAAKKALGPGTFKEQLFDALHSLDEQIIAEMQKVEIE